MKSVAVEVSHSFNVDRQSRARREAALRRTRRLGSNQQNFRTVCMIYAMEGTSALGRDTRKSARIDRTRRTVRSFENGAERKPPGTDAATGTDTALAEGGSSR
jgi:hypothetical protein